MGEVYRAHDSNLRRDVALKVLPGALSADPDRIARFEREARAVAALSHPNILAVHDFGRDKGVSYAVMELLEGRTLRDLLRCGPVPVATAVAMVTQIARGLEAAHGRGIVHRDLKPENVFVLEDGHIKILDFGLAKASLADVGRATTQLTSGGTEGGMIVGTVGYMAPEQLRGEPVDHRTDIFSLGCILYELVAGRRAFQGDSAIDTLHATLHADPDLNALSNVQASLALVVRRCLEKNVNERFQAAADVRFAIEAVAGGAPRNAAQGAAATRRRPWRTVAALAAAVVLAGALGVWYSRAPRESAVRSPFAIDQPRGIAVLPFENLGGSEEAYFAAGVTEEITQQLSKIASLRVISRNAIARFSNPTAQLAEMARDLEIAVVLAGNVRHAGSQVRVSVQLLATPSGELLWNQQFDRQVDSIFDVQSEIALQVTREMQTALTPEERARIERPATNNVEAYELYLRQRTLSTGDFAQNDKGIDMLHKAVALDPAFATGYATLARRLAFRGDRTGRADYRHAVDIARAAVKTDPQLPLAHYALALALEAVGETDDARAAMLRAIELNPNYQSAFLDMSYLETNAGRTDEAVAWAKRAFPRAPNVGNTHYHLAAPVIFLDDQVAERFLLAAARRFPVTEPVGGPRIRMLLAGIDINRGNFAAADERLREVLSANPGNDSVERCLAEAATYANRPDAAERVDAQLMRFAEGRGWFAPYTSRTLRAHLYRRDGQHERARPLIDAALSYNRRAIDSGDRLSHARYENVALHLMRGDRAAALDALDEAIRAGYYDAKFPAVDPLLADLRDDARFAAAVERIAARVREMRQRVDFSDLERWSAK
jgi:serine/threonine protein kinase/predicted Zn-dependent protease